MYSKDSYLFFIRLIEISGWASDKTANGDAVNRNGPASSKKLSPLSIELFQVLFIIAASVMIPVREGNWTGVK